MMIRTDRAAVSSDQSAEFLDSSQRSPNIRGREATAQLKDRSTMEQTPSAVHGHHRCVCGTSAT